MKKVILFLLILIATGFSQIRFLSYTGRTGTQVDTINFDFYCWEITVINDGTIADTIWFWTENSPASNRKIVLLGGEFVNLRFSSSINKLYLQGNKANIPRRVIAKP